MEEVNFCPKCGNNELEVSTFTAKFLLGSVPALILVKCEKCNIEHAVAYIGEAYDTKTRTNVSSGESS